MCVLPQPSTCPGAPGWGPLGSRAVVLPRFPGPSRPLVGLQGGVHEEGRHPGLGRS